MSEKMAVRCPWCGAEMEPNRISYKSMLASSVDGMFWYSCDCGAEAPRCNSEESAYSAAMARYVEALKPLKLHEVTGSVEPCVFMELKGNEAIRACDCVISCDLQCVEVSLIGSARPSWMSINLYGKKWRCWSRRPTDEERAGVAWE